MTHSFLFIHVCIFLFQINLLKAARLSSCLTVCHKLHVGLNSFHPLVDFFFLNLIIFYLFSAVRSKSGATFNEKSSSQRVQRQPSATRGQKTKSSGSSSSSSQINSTWRNFLKSTFPACFPVEMNVFVPCVWHFRLFLPNKTDVNNEK